uniref:Uncharacterized protein n=1 Tax=Arundo donax TaxID=35708 RepID=A0A0A9AF79_ARUDO
MLSSFLSSSLKCFFPLGSAMSTFCRPPTGPLSLSAATWNVNFLEAWSLYLHLRTDPRHG